MIIKKNKKIKKSDFKLLLFFLILILTFLWYKKSLTSIDFLLDFFGYKIVDVILRYLNPVYVG